MRWWLKLGKLKASTNHSNRERRFSGNRYNFHSTITAEEGTQIVDAIDNAPADVTEFHSDEPRKLGTLEPRELISIPLEDLDEAPEAWNYFPLPCLEVLKDIAKSIYSQGQLSPALAWERDNGRYMILGGHTRFRILQFLKTQYPDEADRFSTMNCHIYSKDQIDDAEAQYLIITNNMTQRARESTSIMVKSIIKAFELQKSITHRIWGESQERSNEIVAQNFGISSRSVDRFYRLRTLIPDVMELLDNSEITQGNALKLAVLSPEIQKVMIDLGFVYSSIAADKAKNLINAKTREDVINIMEHQIYAVAPKKVLIDIPIPKGFKQISIAASESDMDVIKSELRRISSQLSDDTKKILLKLLEA